MDGKEHNMYQDAGLTTRELDVYIANGVLGSIMAKVPSYTDIDLTINNFTMYYKPYSLWTTSCQREYTTYDAEEVGKNTGETSYYFFILFIVTLIAFC
jgi:hypothetical protein